MKTYTMQCGYRHVELNDDGTVMVWRDASALTTPAEISLDDPATVLAFAKAVIAQSREAERAKLVKVRDKTWAAYEACYAAIEALRKFDEPWAQA